MESRCIWEQGIEVHLVRAELQLVTGEAVTETKGHWRQILTA